MSKAFTSIAVAFLFCAAMAVAQTTPSSQGGMGTQGTANESPSMQSGQNGTMGQGNGTMGNSSSSMKEKKLKGCIQQQNGQYVLETKKGHMINLTGSDVSAHVGHEVAVHGTWGGGSMSSTSSGSGDHTFNVTSVDMISDHCPMNGKSGSSGMNGSGSQQ